MKLYVKCKLLPHWQKRPLHIRTMQRVNSWKLKGSLFLIHFMSTAKRIDLAEWLVYNLAYRILSIFTDNLSKCVIWYVSSILKLNRLKHYYRFCFYLVYLTTDTVLYALLTYALASMFTFREPPPPVLSCEVVYATSDQSNIASTPSELHLVRVG